MGFKFISKHIKSCEIQHWKFFNKNKIVSSPSLDIKTKSNVYYSL